MLNVRCSTFISFFFDQVGRFFWSAAGLTFDLCHLITVICHLLDHVNHHQYNDEKRDISIIKEIEPLWNQKKFTCPNLG